MNFSVEEATNRSMDRLMATARHGRQPTRPGQRTEIVVETPRGQVSVAFAPEDIEAVILELEADAPCGVCHHNPCTYGRADA